ncbi:Gamma-secretase-activating protein [Larimichthys crocea]|uniref:Uncharacterized protein n=1 Tax=Larimichthys crocea TaxID=215358 RepID=A0ACD3Q979_LARCR|nr:Gamma-secretase-activating protein [Larimichthys crocea]
MLHLNLKFDLHRDVACDLLRKEASVCRVQEYSGAVDTRILNIERDGGILFSWKGATGTTRIGKYDPNTKQNKLLYTFDKQVCVSSCSLNKEETLLAVSLAQNTRGEECLKPISKCLTLLIEIHPISNTKVLKAVDCRVKVQFLNSETDRRSVLESHLLLLTEDGYVDLYHVLLTRQEGYRVVMANPERLSRTVERIVEDFCWVQWDGHTQRLYCLTHNVTQDKFLMRCVQFYLNHNCETVLELPLELPANPFRTVKFVNLGFDHYHMERPEQELVKMEVLTNRTGSMFVCYSQPLRDNQNLIYTVVSVHKDCSKTFRASLGSEQSPQQKATQLHPLFIPIGYYILVYLQGYFLHCINTRQQEMLCHSLFFSGPDLHLDPQCQSANMTVLHAEEESSASLLDLASGRLYTPELSPAYLLQMLQSDTPSRCCSSKTDPQCLAALHCLLVYMGNDPTLELKIIEWLCDNVKAFESFDQIQEFILEVREETIEPHESHGGEHKEARCSIKDFFKRFFHVRVLTTWSLLDKKLVPLFQEEDHQQRALIGLTVDKLREHLSRHLPRLGKKKIDSLVVSYVAKLLELIRHMLESVWLKYKLGPHVLSLKQRGSPAEWSVFHFMFRILEATKGLCLPLPPGYHTLLAVFAVRCLPHHTFLQYIDQGILQLSETFVSRLMTDLDNSDANERLKFSILKRLPEPMEKTIYHMWDHPVSSASISRDYVRTLLEKHNKNKGFAFTGRDKPGFRPEFLPLTYLAKILSDIEEQALDPFEEQENVDARFVEETALKQTLVLLGFEEK